MGILDGGEGDTVSSAATMLDGDTSHGPVASALKWGFKTYFRARQAVAEVVEEARVEYKGGSSDDDVWPPPIAGGSGADEDTSAVAQADVPAERASTSGAPDEVSVSWITPTGVERRKVGEIGQLLDRDDGYVWVDIPALDASSERLLADVFRFHPLAIKDCREASQVPKLHAYDSHLFIVLHAPELKANGTIRHRELNQFIGERFLVTVHERLADMPSQEHPAETTVVRTRIEAGRAHPASPAELSYAIATRISTRMEALVAELARSVAALEERGLDNLRHVSETVVDEMFVLRHELLAIETIADQNQVVCARTAAVAARFGQPDHDPLVADVLDQFLRVRSLCQGQRELLQGVLDFSRTRSTAKMDRAMSRMALLSAIVLPASIISSLYGMNFIVFNQTRFDVLALVLAAMVALTYGVLHWTRSQGWH